MFFSTPQVCLAHFRHPELREITCESNLFWESKNVPNRHPRCSNEMKPDDKHAGNARNLFREMHFGAV